MNLYDVKDDDFHKTLLDNVKKTHTMHEFMAEKYPEQDWDELEDMRQDNGWTMGELMIHLYTEEDPDIYRPMNKMLREATSMDDIDEYWQSYIVVLYSGLKTHAPFIATDTWRGVSDCSSLDVLHVGDEGVLPSFTSTSTDEDAAAGFSGGCTLLHFSGGGYDVSSYSSFPAEAELLVEPGRIYTIAAAEESSDGYERFDCTTDGDGNHAVDEDADADGAAGPISCDDVTAHYGDKWNSKYCPLGEACCEDLTPPPVENSGANCCDCCDSGGDCDGDICQDPDGDEEYYCSVTEDGIDEDDLAEFKEEIGCDAVVLMARTRAATRSLVTVFLGVAMGTGACFLAFAFYSATKKFRYPIVEAEEPSLYEPLAA